MKIVVCILLGLISAHSFASTIECKGDDKTLTLEVESETPGSSTVNAKLVVSGKESSLPMNLEVDILPPGSFFKDKLVSYRATSRTEGIETGFWLSQVIAEDGSLVEEIENTFGFEQESIGQCALIP